MAATAATAATASPPASTTLRPIDFSGGTAKRDTLKALDGLFLMIAEEEKKVRKDPLGSASSIISKVFGAIGK